jgi:hypothetical protein
MGGMCMSTRSLTHVIDTKAVKAVICAIPDHWVVRELTERDYGIDLVVEIFEAAGMDKKGHEKFEASGGLFHIQVKGTENPVKVTKNGYVSQSLTKTFLKYVESFSVPSFLFRVDLFEKPAKIYALWLQGYIRNKLDNKDSHWREKTDYDTLSVRIPESRLLDDETLSKIEEISLRPKYLEQLVEFGEILEEIDSQLCAMGHGDHATGEPALAYLRTRLYRMRRLRILLAGNQKEVNIAAIDEAISYVHTLSFESDMSAALRNLPHKGKFEDLRDTLNGIIGVQDFVDELEDDPLEII